MIVSPLLKPPLALLPEESQSQFRLEENETTKESHLLCSGNEKLLKSKYSAGLLHTQPILAPSFMISISLPGLNASL